MGWVVVWTAIFGAPRFCIFLWRNAVFFRFLAKNRGAPKMAVPTTTHPIPHLTPSELCIVFLVSQGPLENLPSSAADSRVLQKNLVSSLWHTNARLRGTHWVLSPLSSAFETLLSETVFGPFPSSETEQQPEPEPSEPFFGGCQMPL